MAMATATNYVVTVQRPTAVSAVATGYFTAPNEHNLIVAKNTHFEIYLIGSEGLKLIKDVCIYGRINILKCFRLPHMDKDVLFIFTDKHHGMILDCQKREHEQYDIITRSHGLLKDTGRLSLRQPLCTIDTKHGLILLRVLEGVIKIIQLKDLSSKTLEAFSIKIDELNIVDMQFLPGHSRPTFILLNAAGRIDDSSEEYYLRTYQLELRERDIRKLSWEQHVNLSEPSFLVPMNVNPLPAVEEDVFSCLVLGRNAIALYSEHAAPQEVESTLLEETTFINGYCPVDPQGHRYLITDTYGKLYALSMDCSSSSMSISTKMDFLGDITMGEFIVYLGNGLAFLGSHFGDTQLIRLGSEGHLEIIGTYPNLGPILDMSFIDLERQSRQLVTCSGYGKDASLRFIRTGIGIHEYASIDLRNIKGIWSLRINHPYDNHLVVAFFEQTRLFYLQNDEIEEVELPAFDFQHQTLFCTNVRDDQYLQITTHSIRLIGNHGKDLLVEWKNDDREITVASSNASQCMCASGNELFYFEIEQNSLKEISKSQLPYNIACLDITPLNAHDERADLCVVGLWTQLSIRVYRLPTLELLHTESLMLDTLPRSVVMITFDGQPYVVASLADGPIVYYLLDVAQGLLYERKKVSLGTKPTTLTLCRHTELASLSRRVLFACSDRPSVISSSNGKLLFSAVNLREIVCMCSFHSEFYGSSLTLVTDTGVLLGRIDDIQKLHVRSVNLGESARRITFMDEEKAYVLLAQHTDAHRTESIVPISQQAHQKLTCTTNIKPIDDWTQRSSGEHSSVVIVDQHTHEARASLQLLNGEEASSVCIVTFAEDPTTPYIAVGTFISTDADAAPKYCRLLLFRYKNGQAHMVLEKQMNAALYQMLPFQGKLLVAMGNTIRLFHFSTEMNELVQEFPAYTGHIECLQLKVKDDFVLFCDLMQSLTLLRCNVNEKKLEKIAHDPRPRWTTACEFLDDDALICSDDEGNLISCHKNSGSTKENERHALNELGLWHLGEHINVFRRGCLVSPQQSTESTLSLETCTFMGAISGYVGLVLQLPPAVYQLLIALQSALAEHVPSVGKIDHRAWRSFESDALCNDAFGFVDGDLIETYLDLPRAIQSELIKGLCGDNQVPLNTTVEELVKIIEELARIH